MSGIEILGALSAAAGALGAISQGNAQAAALKQSAELARQQANNEINAANANASVIRRQADAEAGAQAAAVAGSGLLLEGSPGEVIAQNRASRIYDAFAQLYQGQAKATALRNQSSIDLAQAKSAKQGAIGAATLSLLQGAGGLSIFKPGGGRAGAGSGLLVAAPPDYGVYL